MERFEQKIVVEYIANIISQTHPRSPHSSAISDWFDVHGHLVGLPPVPLDQDDDQPKRTRRIRRKIRHGVSPEVWDFIATQVEKQRQELSKARPSQIQKRLIELGKLFDLDDTDLAILGLIIRYNLVNAVESLWDEISDHSGFNRSQSINIRILSLFLADRKKHLGGRLDKDGTLIKSGLVDVDEDGDLACLQRLHRIMMMPQEKGVRDMRQLILGTTTPGELEWADFDHIAEARDHVERIVSHALANRTKGINILLYGEPGVGKTEFAKTLAKRLKTALVQVGEQSDAGEEPDRDERLGELRLAQAMMSRGEGGILLFDEVEDLFSPPMMLRMGNGNGPRLGSKAYIHRMLENTPASTLWTTNDIHSMGAAVLRRMTFAIELKVPPAKVRARVWKRILDKNGLVLPDVEVARLAREFPAPPSIASSAVASAKLIGGDITDVRRGVTSLTKVINGGVIPLVTGLPEDLSTDLISADQDVLALLDRISKPGSSRRVSFCLSGPPGSGKTVLAHILAERMGLEVIEKRVSDLESKWVGETEKNIAEAFAEARASESILVFNEADSLLSDRAMAEHSWEVTAVNEMLTWMESHPLPFVATTNLKSKLDPASLRRFLFKIEFGYLKPEQVSMAFRKFFGMEAPSVLASLHLLTPADFDLVRRQAEVLDVRDSRDLAAMLKRENEGKPAFQRSIGF